MKPAAAERREDERVALGSQPDCAPAPAATILRGRYAVAVGSVALAALIRWALDPLVGNQIPYLTFFAAVIVAAWYGGLGPALVAMILGAPAVSWFFIQPRYQWASAAPNITAARTVGFLVVGLIVALFSEAMHRARRRAETAARDAEAKQREAEREAVERRKAEEALQEADRRKDTFLATLAHELRNPLAPVRNALQIMKMDGVSDATAQQARALMERQVQHLVRLVDDLLDVSRIMRDKIELRNERLELTAIFERAAETARPFFEAQGHELHISLTAPVPVVVGDLLRLSQVVANLLVNAAKYTERSGQVFLSGERQQNDVLLRVKDTGVGIAPELLPHIFEPFVQADQTLARTQGGLGIGLTLVRRLTELHGGKVEARSAGRGCGSEFIITLPAAPALTTPTPAAAPAESCGPPRRVLVVDDNVDAANSTAALLRLAGHEVAVAYEGAVAVATAPDFRPDIVLLDIGLPVCDGYEVAKALRSQARNGPFILAALTGYGQKEDRKRSRAVGFDYHLTKPLEPETLLRFIASPASFSALSG
jgi:signal transduction histidine kinase